MKQKFIDMIPNLCKPWVDGASGIPWSFPTESLVGIGNNSLPPDTHIDAEGEVRLVYLSPADVSEAMEELGFNTSFYSGLSGLGLAWEVELMPSVIF